MASHPPLTLKSRLMLTGEWENQRLAEMFGEYCREQMADTALSYKIKP